MSKLLIICGPTATGKTALAVKLAKKFNGELISADSRQVYKGMDIGTGKDYESLEGIPIWMYDVVAPNEEFSVSHFAILARKAVADIVKRKKLAIVIGGTGLYIKALTDPFETVDVPPDKILREKLAHASVGEIQDMISPDILGVMNQSDMQNPRRLIRKIEIEKAGKSKIKRVGYNTLSIGLTATMSFLYKRIDKRVNERVEKGARMEVERLRKQYSWDVPAMSALGYRQWREPEGAIERWKLDEHAYARRQMTWFKKQPGIVWFDITDSRLVSKVAEAVRAWYTEVNDKN